MLVLTLTVGQVSAEDAPVIFDAEALRRRGIDPALAHYFSAAPRFMPGEHRIQLTLNGSPAKSLLARFDSDGQLCFDSALLAGAGLLAPDTTQSASACGPFIQRFPLTQIQKHPQRGEVELVVPSEALAQTPQDLSGFSSGGVAGVINYDVYGLASRFEQGRSRSYSANTEAGFNAGNWIVRSRQLHTSTDGVATSVHQDAYAQRTFTDMGSVLQMGQIQLRNPVLGGAQVNGLQIMNERALQGHDSGAVVEGFAQGAARVEVRQADMLIHTSVVPAGGFVIRNVATINSRADLHVTVIEADGERRDYTVPVAQGAMRSTDRGYVVGAGTLRNAGTAPSVSVISVGGTFGLGRHVSAGSGLMLADDYGATGASVVLPLSDGHQLSTDLAFTRSAAERVSGVQGRINTSHRMGSRWSLDTGFSQQTPGYRELLDTVYQGADTTLDSRTQQRWTGGLGWSHERWGAFGVGYSRSSTFDGAIRSRATASWSRRVHGATLSVRAEQELGGAVQQGSLAVSAVYASVSMPLGGRKRLRANYSNSQGRARISTGFSDTLDDTLGYRVGAERNLSAGTQGFSAGLSALPRYAQMDLGYSGDGAQQHIFNGGLSGGLLLHGAGITPSAQALGDTFALVELGGLSGVKLSSSGGSTWTDPFGRAVVPGLTAFGRSSVELTPKSLPRNIDVSNSVLTVQAGRGAVPRLAFNVMVTQRVLLQVATETGNPPPANATVLDEQGRTVGLVGQDGTVFLANASNAGRLWISTAERSRCELEFTLPTVVDPDAYYRMVPATCRADDIESAS